MKITANTMGVTCGSEFVALGQFPGTALVTAKIQETSGRAAKILLAWSDKSDAWEVKVTAVHPSVPLLPVVLPADLHREEIEIQTGADDSAIVTLKRVRRPGEPVEASAT